MVLHCPDGRGEWAGFVDRPEKKKSAFSLYHSHVHMIILFLGGVNEAVVDDEQLS